MTSGRWEKDQRETSWETDRHGWAWYVAEHWHYTGLSAQALMTWQALMRFTSAVRPTVSGYPRTFFKGIPDPTGSLSRAHRRAVAELVSADLIRETAPHRYDLSPLSAFAFKLRSKVELLRADEVLGDIIEGIEAENTESVEG